MIDDAELHELLRSADPVQPMGSELTGALATLGRDIATRPVAVRSGRRARRRALAALCMVCVIGGGAGVGVAAANGLFARTGRQATGGENGTGEVIRIDAPDSGDVLAQLGAGVPLPPGVSMADVTRPLVTGEPTEASESGLRSAIEFVAACRWATYWLASNASGDAAAMADAQAVLDQVPTWPALVASDGGGVIQMWRNIGAAARAMDPAALNDAGYVINCTDVRPGT